MSAAARWSYTAAATLWPLLSRSGRSGQATFGAPQAITCDYKASTQLSGSNPGREFKPALVLFTERSDIKPGDRVAIGTLTATDPLAAGAREVVDVERFADTFDRTADDFKVMTS